MFFFSRLSTIQMRLQIKYTIFSHASYVFTELDINAKILYLFNNGTDPTACQLLLLFFKQCPLGI